MYLTTVDGGIVESRNMNDKDFVYDELARLFDAPCTVTDDYMLTHSPDWCQKFCGIVDKGKCWKQYFKVRERFKQQNN